MNADESTLGLVRPPKAKDDGSRAAHRRIVWQFIERAEPGEQWTCLDFVDN